MESVKADKKAKKEKKEKKAKKDKKKKSKKSKDESGGGGAGGGAGAGGGGGGGGEAAVASVADRDDSATYCYLCVDIDGARAAYALAQEFVAATDQRYGFSSKFLNELGGSEKARLPELFASDFEWASKGRILVEPLADRMIFKLYTDTAPLACENFVALCTGAKGKSGKSGKQLHYAANCPFHRILQGFVAQAGDITTGTGAGGESIWGKKFKDDKAGLKTKLDRRGLLAMCNTGKNTNTSQFFLTLAPCTKLNGKHVVFGELVAGTGVLDRIEAAGTPASGDGKPSVPVIIVDSGIDA